MSQTTARSPSASEAPRASDINRQSTIPDPQSPCSPTDLALLDSLLTHGLCLSHLSAAINAPLSTLDILAWASQPHIAAHLAALSQLANTAASLRLARARFDAIDALARLTSHQDPTTQRLAATTILRRRLPAAGRLLGIRRAGSKSHRADAGVGLASITHQPDRDAADDPAASTSDPTQHTAPMNGAPAHAATTAACTPASVPSVLSVLPPTSTGPYDLVDPEDTSAATTQPHDLTTPLQAEGLIGHSRGWSAGSASDRSDTPGSAAPNPPYPEGVLGAAATTTTPDPQPAPFAPQVHPPPRAPSAPSALNSSSHHEARTPESLLAELEALTRHPSDDASLDAEFDADQEDDTEDDLGDCGDDAGSDIRRAVRRGVRLPTSDISNLPPLTAQEEAQGKLALEFFQSLRVPLSHPDIIDALAQGRLRDLPQIAEQIRTSRAPP